MDKSSGLLMYKVSGELLHTFACGSDAASEEANVVADPASATAHTSVHTKAESPKWIWVVGRSGRLYVHPKIRGKFHHSSFVRGSVVLAAGSESWGIGLG